MGTLLFVSGGEIFLILVVALILFGAKGIPDIARGLGKVMREIKNATDDIRQEIENSDTLKEVKEVKKSIERKDP